MGFGRAEEHGLGRVDGDEGCAGGDRGGDGSCVLQSRSDGCVEARRHVGLRGGGVG